MDYKQLIQEINALLPRLREIADDTSLPYDTRSQAECSGASLITMLDYLSDDDARKPIVPSGGGYALAGLYAAATALGLPKDRYMSKDDLIAFIKDQSVQRLMDNAIPGMV